MSDFVFRLGLLAQEAAPAAKTDMRAVIVNAMPIVLAAVALYLMVFRPMKREKQQRQDLLDTLKKNDKVITIGGLIGTVANITPDGKEVTLKVDDNTKLRFLRSSIQTVVKGETPASEPTTGN